MSHIGGHSRVVNTAYGLGDLDEKVRLEGGVAQGATSSPLLYIFTTTAAQAYSNSVVHGYPLPRLLAVDLGMPQLTKQRRPDLPQQTRCLLSIPHPCVAYVKGTGYAHDNAVTTGGKAQTQEEARAIYLKLQNATEALTVGLTLVGVQSNLEKKISTCSPVMLHLLGEEPKLKVAAINSRGQLIRAAITTVPTTGDAIATTPAERGAVRYLGPCFCNGGCLDKITGEDAGYWRENRNATASILSLVRDNFSAALASYDTVSKASVTVLYQRLRTLLLLDPPTPEFMMKMRGVVANSGMRALGLAPMNEELDNEVTVFLLSSHLLGGGGMGDPVIKYVQDSAITILAGLQHDSIAVRANYENLLAHAIDRTSHARDRTRDIFSVRGDPTVARCLQFL